MLMGAVLAANGLTLWFVYSAWTVSKIEKAGGSASDAPWTALLGLIIPCLFVAGCALALRAWEGIPGHPPG
jgi:hypothetical protein